jgi:hypothetical protein
MFTQHPRPSALPSRAPSPISHAPRHPSGHHRHGPRQPTRTRSAGHRNTSSCPFATPVWPPTAGHDFPPLSPRWHPPQSPKPHHPPCTVILIGPPILANPHVGTFTPHPRPSTLSAWTTSPISHAPRHPSGHHRHGPRQPTRTRSAGHRNASSCPFATPVWPPPAGHDVPPLSPGWHLPRSPKPHHTPCAAIFIGPSILPNPHAGTFPSTRAPPHSLRGHILPSPTPLSTPAVTTATAPANRPAPVRLGTGIGLHAPSHPPGWAPPAGHHAPAHPQGGTFVGHLRPSNR